MSNDTEHGEGFDLLSEILSGKWDRNYTPEELAVMRRNDTLEEAQGVYEEYRNRVLPNLFPRDVSGFWSILRGTDKADEFVIGIRDLIEKHRAIRDDWASRSYKTSRKVVEVADRSDAFTIAEGETNRLSTNYINTRRRQNRVDYENSEIKRLQEDLVHVFGKYLLERIDKYVLS